MENQNFLSTIEANFARKNPAVLSKLAQSRAGGYFADWVMASLPKYFTYETTEDVVITTTFDPVIQNAAEKAVKRSLKIKLANILKHKLLSLSCLLMVL